MSNDHPKLTRRDILKQSSAIIPASLIASTTLTSRASEEQRIPQRILGRTGEKLSQYTLGTGHFRAAFKNQKSATALVDRALELGINSIDTAPNYGEAEDYIGVALKGRRDKIFLAGKNEEATAHGSLALLETTLKKLQTDHLDLVYIHNIGLEERFPSMEQALGNNGILKTLVDAKKRGLVRYIGVSGHLNPSCFEAVLKRDEIDVYMCAVNCAAKHVYDFETKVFEPARKKNCGLIAMKVLGGPANWNQGTARFAGERLQNAIRYALQLPGVCSANIGVRSIAELEETVKIVSQAKPFSAGEFASVQALGKQLATEWGAFYGEPTT